MVTSEVTKQQIHQIVEDLPEEQLAELLRYLENLQENISSDPVSGIAPIYEIHHQAFPTGVLDLAEHHDHYLYNVDKDDA